MNSKDILENIVYFLKISIVDETNNIKKQLESVNSKFINLETYDCIDEIDIINTSTILANINNVLELDKIISLAKEHEHITFLVAYTNILKTIKLDNLHIITNLKSIDKKLLKIYKKKYENESLYLKFANGVSYNLNKKILFDINKEQIRLTQRELDLIILLINNTQTVLTHKEIQGKIWHQSYEVSESAYKSLLNKIRGKIGKKTIKSISRKGYIINFQ